MKSREHVITNGRAVFYACCWPDLKDAALNCGWALGLHGSLNSDMDLMAMPWTEDAKPVEEMIKALEACFTIPDPAYYKQTTKSTDKPNNRAVYTMHIFADFYLDINVIEPKQATKPLSKITETDAIELIQLWMFGNPDRYPITDFKCELGANNHVYIVRINNDWFNETFRIGLTRGALWCETHPNHYKVSPSLFKFLENKGYKLPNT